MPQLAAAVGRHGACVLVGGAGEPPPAPDVQFRIGSITKTFTAVLVLQLRDDGLLDLDDPLDRHVPDTPVGGRSIRELLSHTSGLTREPPGPFWEASPGSSTDGLVGGLHADDLVLPAARFWHYSNLAFGLLGAVVERRRGAPFRDVLRDRLLTPLALDRTSWLPSAPHATGFRRRPHADVLTEEPTPDTGAMGPAGQLWSTPTDLVAWGSFLADPDPVVLAPATVEEMCEPIAMADAAWRTGWGLGLQLFRAGDRVLVGHGGSMPGFTAGLVVARRERVVAAAAANAWHAAPCAAVAVETVVDVLDGDPQPTSPWTASPPAAEVLELVGPWYYRGGPWVVDAPDGVLRLRPVRDATDEGARRFVAVGPDRFRGLDGDDRGELLRVARDELGQPVVLDVASWRFVRAPDDPRGGP